MCINSCRYLHIPNGTRTLAYRVLGRRARTRQWFCESYPALDRLPRRWPQTVTDCILDRWPNGPVLWPQPAARYGATWTAAGAAQLEVFLTGTARTPQGFGEPDHDPARDRDHGWPACQIALSCGRGPVPWRCNSSGGPCPVAAARYGATAAGAAQLEVFLTGNRPYAAAPVLQWLSPIPPGTVTADCITWMARRPDGPVLWARPGTVTVHSSGGRPNLMSSWLGRPARASASVSPIQRGTEIAARDCVTWMARGPDGPVRWPRPGTVQHWQQRGQPSLKSSWLGLPLRACQCFSTQIIFGHGYPKDIHISDVDIHISDMDILYSDMDILRGTYLYISTS